MATEPAWPVPYSTWHADGLTYTVLATAQDAESGAPVVVYLDVLGNVWVRPLARFLERFAPEDDQSERGHREAHGDGE